MPLTTAQKSIILAALVILVGGALLLWAVRPGEETMGPGVSRPVETQTVEGGTRGELPSGQIQVPEPIREEGSYVTQRGEEAVPTTVIETPETDNAFRHFELRAEGNRYTPSRITVREGDVVDIRFTAVDRNYTFYLPDFGIYQLIQQGQSKTIQFQAYPYGTYAFSCKDVCQGFQMLGTIVVVE